jgi:hypothetical protein
MNDPATTRHDAAIHEAGHAIIGRLVGMKVTRVTIAPSVRGVNWGRCRMQFVDELHLDVLVGIVQPVETVQRVESHILAVLAGEAARKMLGGRLPDGFVATSEDERWAKRASAVVAGSGYARLRAAEGLEPMAGDEREARGAALALWGDEAIAAAYLNYLRVRTNAEVVRYAPWILGVADALMEHETISGKRLDKIGPRTTTNQEKEDTE